MKTISTGYSGTPLIKKLGIKPEMKILLLNQPDEYYDLLRTNISNQLCKKNEVPDLIHLFVKKTMPLNQQWRNLNL